MSTAKKKNLINGVFDPVIETEELLANHKAANGDLDGTILHNVTAKKLREVKQVLVSSIDTWFEHAGLLYDPQIDIIRDALIGVEKKK